MALVVIVGDYSAFVSKVSIRRIDKTNVELSLKLLVRYPCSASHQEHSCHRLQACQVPSFQPCN